jgi:hypothetical protein
MENQQSFRNILLKAIYENSENKLFKESFNPECLEEGWKDNLKKGLATAAVAGSLIGGNPAKASDSVHWSLPDGAQQAYEYDDKSPIADLYQAQNDIEAFAKENNIVKTDDGYYTDQYGNKFNEHDLEELMAGRDPFAEATEDEADWMVMWKNSRQKKDDEPYIDYLHRLKDSY